MLPIPWNAACGRAVLNAVAEIRTRMESHNLSLREAQQLLHDSAAKLHTPEGTLNWRAVADAFLASRSDRRNTTQRDLRTRVERALKTLQHQPHPKNGPELMRRYAADHFASLPARRAGTQTAATGYSCTPTFRSGTAGSPDALEPPRR